MACMDTARITDVTAGVSVVHGGQPGVVVTGCSKDINQGQQICRITSIVVAACGHTGVMVSCSNKEQSCNQWTCRVGDVFAGSYTGVIVSAPGGDRTG